MRDHQSYVYNLGTVYMKGGRSKIAKRPFRLGYRYFGGSGYQVGKEKKENCRPSAAERPAAAMFVLFCS